MPSDTREALIQAAQESFAQCGYHGTSIRQLAAAVGIKESSVYKHFPSKAAILDAVIELARERMEAKAAHLRVPFNDAGDAVDVYATIPPAHLKAASEEMLHLWLHDPEVVAARRMLTLDQYRTPEAGQLLRDWTVNDPVSFQTNIFAALIERGAFRPADPQAVALAFWGPILAILTAAEESNETEAIRRLHLHIDHFTATHLVASEMNP